MGQNFGNGGQLFIRTEITKIFFFQYYIDKIPNNDILLVNYIITIAVIWSVSKFLFPSVQFPGSFL